MLFIGVLICKYILYHVRLIIENRLINLAVVIFSFMLSISISKAQSQADSLSDALTNAGFENIRVMQVEAGIYISLEDNVYRWNVLGVSSALDIISKQVREDVMLNLYLLKRGIPQITLQVPLHKYQYNKNDSTFNSETFVKPDISYRLNKEWYSVKKVSKANSNTCKADVVVYPQFAMQNTTFRRIYEIQLNIAPALELSCWKGMKFTGQVIFPVINQLGYEGDFIRPGFVTLAQEFRLPGQWFGRATVGNFNANRYGVDLDISHYFADNRWSIGFNAGLTGFSYFYKNIWLTTDINTITWFAKAQYFYPGPNLQFNFIYGRFIHGDYGFRIDFTRHFKATSIGFYGMYTGGKPNGGFHFAIPLPPAKRNRRHCIRVVPPNYFDWEYNAGTEFYYGRYYETRPNENRSEQLNNLIFIKNE
jgi:hypothetical protein